MKDSLWADGLPVAITVCDRDGIILYMNDKSALTFAKDGGRDLVGKSVLDCHPEPSRTKLKNMIAHQTTNIYTIEKAGVKKLIYQVPWMENGVSAGFVELALEIPFEMPHFVREP